MKKTYKSYFLYLNSGLYFWLDWFCSQSFFLVPPYTLLLTCFVFLIHSPLTDKKSFAFFYCVFGFIIEVVGVKLD
jgi:putative membrane protein